jgi:UDP-N-acetylmuramate--alanine ligase
MFELLVPGFYNVRNALACIAISSFFDVNRQDVREALAEFRGARRRFDRLGEAAGVMVFDDYGHHPTEVRVTLDAARQEFPKRRLVCVFQPHQCSRTRLLMNDFAGAFGSADCVIVPDIYSVRDSAEDRASVNSQDLVATLRSHGVQAEYGSQFPETVDRLLHSVRSGDLVMTMGAGPVNDVGIQLLLELKKREQGHELVLRT